MPGNADASMFDDPVVPPPPVKVSTPVVPPPPVVPPKPKGTDTTATTSGTAPTTTTKRKTTPSKGRPLSEEEHAKLKSTGTSLPGREVQTFTGETRALGSDEPFAIQKDPQLEERFSGSSRIGKGELRPTPRVVTETKPSGFLFPSTKTGAVKSRSGSYRTKAAAFKSLTKRKEEADIRHDQQQALVDDKEKKLKELTAEFEKIPFMGTTGFAALPKSPRSLRSLLFSADPDTRRKGVSHLGDWRALVPDALQEASGSDDPVGFSKSAKAAAALYDRIQRNKSELETLTAVEKNLQEESDVLGNALAITKPRETGTQD